MNYLAHAYLSFDMGELLVGNFIADTVKGKIDKYSDGIQQGIRMHHQIDEFTDNNAYFKNSVSLINHDFGLYATIIVDMFYDHFLAANWAKFSDEPLEIYSRKVYASVLAHYTEVPWRMKRMLVHMMHSNWLLYYRNADSFKHFFKGLAFRTRFAPDLHKAADEIHIHYQALNRDFLLFMDDMIPFAKSIHKKI